MILRRLIPILFLLVPLLHAQMSESDKKYFDEFTKVKRNINTVKEKHLLRFLSMAGVATQTTRDIAGFVAKNKPITDLAVLLGVPSVTQEDYTVLTNRFVAPPSESDAAEDLTVDDILEKAAGGEEESVDSSFRDDLSDLAARPVDINTASPEELGRLPWLTPYNIYNIIEYRKTTPFTKPEDLLKVRGIDEETLRQLKPFIAAAPPRLAEITAKVEGARRARMRKAIEGEFTSRIVTGYPYSEEQFSTYGYPSTVGLKETLKLLAFGRAAAGAAWERDKGEKDLNDLQKYYLEVHNLKFLRMLILGNFRLRFGQGLTIGDSGPARGAAGSSTFNSGSAMIKPDLSTSENLYYFGGAGLFSWKGIDLAGFYSDMAYDATVEDLATLGDGVDDTPGDRSDDVISSYDPNDTGLHSTPSEISRKDAVTKTVWGGRIQYSRQSDNGFLRQFLVGFSAYRASWDLPVDPPMIDDNYYSFRGRTLGQTGFDWNIGAAGLSFMGEVSASFQPEIRRFVSASNAVKKYGIGLITGLVFSTKNWKTEALFRSYGRDFFGFEKSALSEFSSPNGETGFYLSQMLKVDPGLRFQGYFDLFRKDWRTYSEVIPPFGWESFVSAEKTFADKLVVFAQVKGESKEMRLTVNGVGRNTWVDNDWRYRLETKWSPRRTLTWKLRFETARTRIRDLDKAVASSLFFGDVACTVSPNLKVWFRNVVFDGDYDAGIWEYENEIPAYMSSGAFYGQGNRMYIHTRSTIVPGKLFLYLKLGMTWYFRKNSITPVLSEIDEPASLSESDQAGNILGDTKYDIHCQIVYNF